MLIIGSKWFGPYDTNIANKFGTNALLIATFEEFAMVHKKKEMPTYFSLESANLWNASDTFRKVITVLLIELGNSNQLGINLLLSNKYLLSKYD